MKRVLIRSVVSMLAVGFAVGALAQSSPSANGPPPKGPRPPAGPGAGNPGGPKVPPRPGPRPQPGRPPLPNWPHRYRLGPYRPPHGYFLRHWRVGDVLPGLFRIQLYWISAPGRYGLPYPPPGAHWVRVNHDALLVSDLTGRIINIAYNIFF